MTRFAWGLASDTGRVRQANEDSMLAVDGLFAVADGMGGHKAGEVASHLAIETLQERFTAAGTDVLVTAVQEANRALVERSSGDGDLTGMGTTMCAMALVDADGRDAIAVVNVGDSRLYLLSDGELTQITEDHSLVATLERQGRLSPAEAAVHPQRNVVTRALGIDVNVMVDSWEILPVIGDRYLICSDGLFNEVDDNRLAATLRRLADPKEATKELVRLANEAGGRDNITCVVVDVMDDSGHSGSGPTSATRVLAAHTGGEAADDLLVGPPPTATDGPAGAGDGNSPDGTETETDVNRSGPGDPADPAAAAAAKGGRRARRQQAKAPRPPRRRILTWRVGLFTVVLLAIAAVAVGVVVYTGRNTYFVGVDGGQVAIFRGKPGGVLWIDPELAESTAIPVDAVPAATVDAVRDGVEEPTLDDARRYVANLRDQIDRSAGGSRGPTTTVTTDPTITTAARTDPAATSTTGGPPGAAP